MKTEDDFFIGWRDAAPKADRRFLLAAGIALVAGAGALGAGLSMSRPPIGDGFWAMGIRRTLPGLLTTAPYPALRTTALDGRMRTIFLATAGKTAPRFDPAMMDTPVAVTGSMITRGDHAMIAVEEMVPATQAEASVGPHTIVDRGAVTMLGEILDAKCWFGAMRPGYGKTHKACAALCARGGLPLAFCELATCGQSQTAPLFLDENARAFDARILPLVADPIAVSGRLVQVNDVLQLRVALAAVRRI